MLMMRLIEAQKRACRNQNLMALAVLDLDGFKTINDRLGHAVGDQKLLSATAAVRTAIRDIDMIARVGGDEFVLILEDLKSLREVKTILYRIVRAVDLDANEGDACYKVTASLGATIYPIDFAEPEILLKHADEAMYQAKRRKPVPYKDGSEFGPPRYANRFANPLKKWLTGIPGLGPITALTLAMRSHGCNYALKTEPRRNPDNSLN